MESLITPGDVVRLAFADGEWLPSEAVPEAAIAAAAFDRIVPVAGRALYDRLLEGAYPELRDEYVAPALACAVRQLLQPLLDVRTGRCGTTAPAVEGGEPASDEALERLARALRRRTLLLLRRLSAHLEGHASAYPEYDPEKNIFNRTAIHGNLIQTL